jgi:methionine aminopeptidase
MRWRVDHGHAAEPPGHAEGVPLKPGMFVTIEPMINLGRRRWTVLSNLATARSLPCFDGSFRFRQLLCLYVAGYIKSLNSCPNVNLCSTFPKGPPSGKACKKFILCS